MVLFVEVRTQVPKIGPQVDYWSFCLVGLISVWGSGGTAKFAYQKETCDVGIHNRKHPSLITGTGIVPWERICFDCRTLGLHNSLKGHEVGGQIDAGKAGIHYRGYRARRLLHGWATAGQGLRGARVGSALLLV